MPPKPITSATQETQITVNASAHDNNQEFGVVCLSLREHLEQAYELVQQMQSFDLGYFEGLAWTYTNERGEDRIMVMADMLPSADMLEAFLKQCDRCNALAVKLCMDNSAGQMNSHSALNSWQARHQLAAEIDKAKTQASNIILDINMKFTDADNSLNSSRLKDDGHFRDVFQANHDDYITLLNANMDNLDQAGQLATRLSRLFINPFAQNLP